MRLPRRALLAGSAALPFAALRHPARAQRAPGVITFGLSSYPPNLNVWQQTGTASLAVKMLIYRGLLSFGPEGEIRGELAESYAQDGPTAWVFRLRPNAVFHSGRPVTAEDVKWSLEQVAAERSTAYMRAEMQSLARIETPDARTVRIVTKEPTATLPLWFAGPHLSVVQRGSTEGGGGSPVGCGPFALRGQERGVSVELAAFDRFYKPGVPKLKGIRYVAYADENARVAALQAGDVDLIEYVPWQSMATLEADPRLKLDNVDGPFMGLQFNGETGPFKDARLRKAVGFAIRREEIVNAAFFGRGSPLNGVPLAKGTEFYDERLANYWRYDPARAKALMAEAGVAGGFQATLLSTAQYGMHKSTAEVVQQHLGEIGIQVRLNLPDWATRVNLGSRGQYEFAVMGTTADNNDPDGLASIINADLGPSVSRSYRLPTPKIARLLAAGRAELDPAKRKAIYAEMQRVALEEEVPMVGLAWRSQGYAMTRDVRGFRNMPGSLTFYSAMTLEDTSFG